jgi:hypothetical protein
MENKEEPEQNIEATTPNAGPVFQKRLGSVRVAVFLNVSKDGQKKWYGVRITRTYRKGDVWKEIPSFNGLADLALVEEGVRYAKEFINEHALAA